MKLLAVKVKERRKYEEFGEFVVLTWRDVPCLTSL